MMRVRTNTVGREQIAKALAKLPPRRPPGVFDPTATPRAMRIDVARMRRYGGNARRALHHRQWRLREQMAERRFFIDKLRRERFGWSAASCFPGWRSLAALRLRTWQIKCQTKRGAARRKMRFA